MKKIIKLLIIIFIVFLFISSIVYIDYFNAKSNNTNPKISIKVESENSILYKAAFYRVYYCKTNKKYVFADYNEEVVCPNNYNYINGYYTNSEDISISKRDLQLLTNDGIYTSEMIEGLKTEGEVKNAVNVAYEFGLIKYKVLEETDEYSVVLFPEFEEDEDGYDWKYDEESNKYCFKGENYNYLMAKYDNNKCGKYERVKMNEQWCTSYKTSTLVYLKGIENLCK
jgi:hypothetical protein